MSPRQPPPDGVPLLWGDRPTQMGRGVTLPPAGAAGSAFASVLDARGNDHLPQLVTAFIAVSPGSGAPTNAPLFVQLQASWGVGGAIQTALVSARRGTAFTVGASTLRIDAQNLAPFETNVSAVLAYGARPARPGDLGPVFEPAPFDLGDGASVDVPIPPFAQSVTLLLDRTAPPPPPPPPPPRLTADEAALVLDPALSVVLVADAEGGRDVDLGGVFFPDVRDVPLPSGFGLVRVRSNQAGPLVCRPLFSLAL
jgi:hypothetical protein